MTAPLIYWVNSLVNVKPGVHGLDQVHPLLLFTALVYGFLRLTRSLGRGTITSAMDGGDAIGRARSADSAHPYGMALDFRTNDLAQRDAAWVAQSLVELCEGLVTVILEEDHIHVQVTNWRQLRAQRVDDNGPG